MKEVRRTTLGQAVSYYEAHPPKGEFVLVVEGAPPVAEQAPTLEDGLALVDKLQLRAGPPGTRSKRRQQPAGSPGKCSMTVCLPERKNLNLDDSGRSACRRLRPFGNSHIAPGVGAAGGTREGRVPT